MNDTLMYFLKVNIAIALFYLFYRLFFAGDTFWKARRYYLLFSILVSLGYPFLSIENWMQKQEPVQRIIVNYASLPEIVVSSNRQTSIFTFENIMLAIYFFVVLLLLVKFMIQLISIFKIRMTGKPENIQGIAVIAVDKEISPFSFFNAIYINPALHNTQETNQILLHEQTHVKQLHSVDVIVSEILIMLFWFNPAAWLLKREIRQNLEFLADNNVLKSGFDSRTYQYHLLQLAYQTPNLELTNKFNVSPLKKRITMMNKQKTAKARILKYSLIVPLALALIVSSNAQNVISSAKKIVAPKAQTAPKAEISQKAYTATLALESTQNDSTSKLKPGQKLDEIVVVGYAEAGKEVADLPTQPSNEPVYDVIEKMPVFPGGENKLLHYIGSNLRYPVDAQKSGTQGRVIARFVINKLGKVEKAEILRGVSTSIDQEALRVINAMPQWIPGEQSGKKVSVYYVLPIIFKLEGDSKSQDRAIPNDPAKQPVFVVDGVIQPKGFDVHSLKPENIESVNVNKADTEAKKAEFVAKYGKEGANGVIIITSKK
jgi:TonB family protein